MLKPRLASFVRVVFVAALVLGCRDAAEPDTLAVSLVLSKVTVGQNDPVLMTLAATNVGSRPLSIESACKGLFRVMTAKGEEVGLWDFCPQLLYAVVRDLAPGEQVAYVHQWDGIVRGGQLPAGEYRLQGMVSGRWSGPVRIVVKAPAPQ